jgi:RNA polymerase sigma-70 factor (ECF subfamily)
MPDHFTFDELMGHLRSGSPDAAAAIFSLSEKRLLALARKNLDSRFRRKLDPDDIVQSVYKSFFAGCADGEFNFESWDSIWATLALMTVRKCRNMIEHLRAARRDVSREDACYRSWLAASAPDVQQPTPSEVIMLAESVDRLTSGVDKRQREVISLTLQGFSVAEISSMLGRAERSVRREVGRMKERALNLLLQSESSEKSNRKRTRTLRRPGLRRARCQCGHQLLMWLTPWGYKSNCPKCGAMLELQPGDIDPEVARQATHAVVTCVCGTRIVILASDANSEKNCPHCQQSFVVPPVLYPS